MNSYIRKLMTLTLIGAYIGLALVLAPANAQTTLKLGIVTNDRDPIGRGAKRFADAVARISDGAIHITIVSRAALGGINEHWAQVRAGALDMTVIDTGAIALVREARWMAALGTPFLYRDLEHMRAVADSELVKEWAERIAVDTGIRLLGQVGERPPRMVSTISKPIKRADDLKGLKIRVPPSRLLSATFKAWGAIPTPTAPGEMYIAMKTGLVDGNEIDAVALVSSKTVEVVKHVTPINYTQSSVGAWISEATWARLSARERNWLQRAAKDAGQKGRELYQQALDRAIEAIKTAGVAIHEPEIETFKTVRKTIVEQFEGKAWPKGTVEAIRNLR